MGSCVVTIEPMSRGTGKSKGPGAFGALVALACAVAILAPSTASAFVASNPTLINMPNTAGAPASVYPSTITVPTLPPSTIVTGMRVTLHGVSSEVASTMDVLLVGPQSVIAPNNVILMSDVCTDPANIDITFATGAGNPLADPCTAGTYAPTDAIGGTPDFPDMNGAPAGPYGASLGSLCCFFGDYRLYVRNNGTAAATASILGWTLELTEASPLPPGSLAAALTPPSISSFLCGGLPVTIFAPKKKKQKIVGTPGPDVIKGNKGRDVISGLGGDDAICGGRGKDKIVGDDGNDSLFGQEENDVLGGGAGFDRLSGGAANDYCNGTAREADNDCERGPFQNLRLEGPKRLP